MADPACSKGRPSRTTNDPSGFCGFGYIVSNVSQTSIVAPLERTGQLLAGEMAAWRQSALMML